MDETGPDETSTAGPAERRLSHLLVYLAVRVAIAVVQAMDLRTFASFARFLAVVLVDWIPIRKRVLEENLAHAFPNWSAVERKQCMYGMWEHLLLFIAEIAHAPRKIHQTNWRRYVRMQNSHLIVDALLADRPVVVVSAHFGNFEVSGYVLAVLGFPTWSIARTLDNPYLDEFLLDFRGRKGQHVIPKRGGYDQIVDVISSKKAITVLGDQYAGAKGCWVDFFGRPASTHKAIGLLALANDAPLIVGTAARGNRPLLFHFCIEGAVDPRSNQPEAGGVKQITQWFTSALEQAIRRHPSQYWWLHRRWKPKKKPAEKALRAAA